MKKQKSIVGSIILSTAIFLCACTNKADNKTVAATTISADSMIIVWNNAWNKDDSLAISDMFTDQSVFLSGTRKIIGTDSIMKKWVNKQLPKISNLSTEKITSGATNNMVFYTGFYTLDLTTNDSITGKADGNFSAIWKKQDDNAWKIELIHFGN